MLNRRLFFSLMLTVMVGITALIGCSSDQKTSVTAPESGRITDTTLQPEGYGAQWPSYTQGYRNTLLLSVGYQDIGGSGGQCKEWVRTIVARTTDSRVAVPATMSNNYMWYSDPSGHILGQSMVIQNVQPGQVVQMSWTGHLHTFFLAGKNSSGMYWLDSNWGLDGKVQYHYVTYAYFNGLPNLKYSVYTIGW